MSNQLKKVHFLRTNVFFAFLKTLPKITFKHHLSEIYLLHEKGQPLSFHYALRQSSFTSIHPVIEERRWHISKDMIMLSTVHNLKRIPLISTVHTQNM